ncbi:MAG: hypothetical protein JSR21_15290 [Proteobacteria bacterium]|nr:hypothetical protein [Pseudomonadota bacterium]
MTKLRRIPPALAIAAAAAGCTATYTQLPGGGWSPPTVYADTPGGVYPIYTPDRPMPGGNLAAPPGMGGGGGGALPAPGGGGPGGNDGTYDGSATLLSDLPGSCPFHMTMTNMHVRNGEVRFASYRGRIDAGGYVRMADGSLNWMMGRFEDGQFSGTYTNRYCTYSLALSRVGP